MAPEGRIIDSMLSEHYDEGMLEAYTLTGRHGFFASYEVFIREVDDMIVQHFKWLNHSHDVSWRKDVPALNIIADSTVFQQDHNGYSHQDPGVTTMALMSRLWTGFFGTESCRTPKIFQNPDFSLKRRDFWVFV
ncbi:hypothetical protein LME02_14160 [Leuconostoc mesenteroides subsp. dextranicum]|nr:hypothetical protein LME02_14160 [Leuconostoc mesenteroides subsp. dextranicum]